MDTATAENQTSKSYAILPLDSDRIEDHQTEWVAFFSVTQAGGGTSPTTDVYLETSAGDHKWIKVASATQLTADGSVDEMKSIDAMGPHVRVRSVVAGTPKPGHTVNVKLASNAHFRLVEYG